MSCDVDIDVEEEEDADVDVNFEELEGNYLQIAGKDTLSFTDQFIVSFVLAESDYRKT